MTNTQAERHHILNDAYNIRKADGSSVSTPIADKAQVYVAVYCNVLQCVAVCCSVLQCVAVCCSVLQYNIRKVDVSSVSTPVADKAQVCVARVLQCVAVCCSVLQCVAVCCSVLQCVAV